MVDHPCLFLARRRRQRRYDPKADGHFTFHKCLKRFNKQLYIFDVREIERYNNVVQIASDRWQLARKGSLQKLEVF